MQIVTFLFANYDKNFQISFKDEWNKSRVSSWTYYFCFTSSLFDKIDFLIHFHK